MQGNNALKSFQVHGPFASGKPGEHVYPTEKRANSAARKLDAHLPKPGTAEHDFHVKMNGSVPKHTVKPAIASKAFKLLSIGDCYDALVKDQAGVAAYHSDAAKRKAPDASRTAHVDRPPPTTSDVGSRAQNEKRVSKFPRKMKPTIQMKPVSNEEAAAHLRSGTYSAAKQKSLRWLSALKALATGYGKTAGGGALKAANRGKLSLLGPSGRAAGKSGGHYRKRSLSGKVNFGPDGRHGARSKAAKFGKLRRAIEEEMSAPVGSLFVSEGRPRAASSAAVAELSDDTGGVVIKSKGDQMRNQNVDFNDLFKSELAADHLVDCPHCEEPITKSDLAKAKDHEGKKRGKSSAHVSAQNGKGGEMRGGDGRGVHTPSRPGSGVPKDDPPAGVQNSKGSRTRKGGNDDASSDAGSDDDVDKSAAPETPATPATPAPAAVKKSITVRGTEYVQYVDDGSDAAIAKSISEGALGGTSPTRPLDLNNDLTRLLI